MSMFPDLRMPPWSLISVAAKPISDADDRFDVARTLIQLLSQPADVDVEGTRVAEIIISPNVIEQLLASRDAARAVDHVCKQGKFFPRELDLTATTVYPHVPKVDRKPLVLVSGHAVLFYTPQ